MHELAKKEILIVIIFKPPSNY